MRPVPLHTRIIAALQLAPMTAAELTRTLSANPASVRHYVDEMRGLRVIASGRTVGKTGGRPRNVWGIA